MIDEQNKIFVSLMKERKRERGREGEMERERDIDRLTNLWCSYSYISDL